MEDVYESLEGFAGLDGLPNINEQSSTFAFFVKKENWKVFKNKKL